MYNSKVERSIPGRVVPLQNGRSLMKEFCKGVLKEDCEDNFLGVEKGALELESN